MDKKVVHRMVLKKHIERPWRDRYKTSPSSILPVFQMLCPFIYFKI